MGYSMAGMSVLTLLGGAIAPQAMGPRISAVSFLGIFVAIGLLNMEDPSYRAALLRGGTTARWWPPLLWVIGSVFVVTIVMAIFRT